MRLHPAVVAFSFLVALPSLPRLSHSTPLPPGPCAGSSNLSTGIDVSWIPAGPPFVIGQYNVYRDGVQIAADINAVHYLDPITNPEIHNYCVEATDLTGVSSQCCTSGAFGFSLSIGQSGSGLSLTWTTLTNITGFRLYRNGTLIASPSATSSAYFDPSLPPGGYQYRLEAYNGTTTYSLTQSALIGGTPSTPGSFVATDATSCGAIHLSWVPVPGVSGYNVYRNSALIAKLGPTVSEYIDYKMPGAGTYLYSIESEAAGVVSPQANSSATLTPPRVTVDPADWFSDVFPADDPTRPPELAYFDTATVVPSTGRNLAPTTGDTSRGIHPGPNVIVNAAGALSVRMYFRIKPGPGNYVTIGKTSSGVRTPVGSWACPNDGSFWGRYIGPCPYPPPAPAIWNPNAWYSELCDQTSSGVFQSTLTGAPILPVGVFTPGTVVQYYFEADFGGGDLVRVPDPNCVMQVRNEGSLDGHRWQQFCVLPDKWKDAAFGGDGLACMLVVDLEDGRGNERVWAGIADSLGLSRPAAAGAYSGWAAPGYVLGSAPNPVDLDDPSVFVNAPTTAPGTAWDLYNVRGWQTDAYGNAGALGSRLGNVVPNANAAGPSLDILSSYYRIVLLLTGDRSTSVLGPVADRSADDVTLLHQFLGLSVSGLPRAVVAIGNGFAESEQASHPSFLNNDLSTIFRSSSYATLSGNSAVGEALTVLPPISANGDVFSLANASVPGNDVLEPSGLPAVAGSRHQDYGIGSPYYASIYKPQAVTNESITEVEGWNIADLSGILGGTSFGRLAFYTDVFGNLLSPICPLVFPEFTNGVPGPATPATNTGVLGLSNNPLVHGVTTIRFALAKADRVDIRILDVSGRTVRHLSHQEFGTGEFERSWDGRGDHGEALSPSVYFASLRFERSGKADVRRVIILR